MTTADEVAFWGIDIALRMAAEAAKGRKRDVRALPDGVRQVFLIVTSNPEFAGIDGWLETGDGDWALDTVDALLEIGALGTAKILNRALAVFPTGAPQRKKEEREDLLAAMNGGRPWSHRCVCPQAREGVPSRRDARGRPSRCGSRVAA